MRLLTSQCTILLTVAFCARAAHAQDSPIYVNDNGNVPFENTGQKGKSGAKKKRTKSTKAPRSLYETHIHYDRGHGIQNKNKEIYIEEKGYQAVCLENTDGSKISLATGRRWALTTLSAKDNAVVSSNGLENNHIHIDPGKTMGYNPPNDLDDPDPDDVPNGKKNQMTGAVFDDGITTSLPLPFKHNSSIIIHYCGPTGCNDEHGVDRCADAKKLSPK